MQRTVRAKRPVAPERADAYRTQGLWDDRVLRDGVEAAARRRPGALAVAGPDATLSYVDLVYRIGDTMTDLANQGVGRGDTVLLLAGNTAFGVVAYHALLRLGSTVVLLDRRAGVADLEHARPLLTGSGCVVSGPDASGAVHRAGLAVLELPARISDAHAVTQWAEPARDAPALVIFTSGTTARPRGVVHSLNTLTAGARNMAGVTQTNETSTIFLVSPLSSIAGVMQMHLAADTGAALVLEDRFEAAASLDRLNAAGATVLGGAPVIAERLLEEAGRRTAGSISLRTLALGGAMLPRPLLDMASETFGIDVVRVYGSSEAPNFSGSDPGDSLDIRLADDGVLQPGSEVRIGSTAHPQEGLVRGPAVCLGYVEESDNVEAFEDGWFRTGDLLELHEGRVTVMGRLKETVNRNGLKISLAEVEAALAGLPGAREAACFAVPDPVTGERLAVAVHPEPGAVVTLEQVAAYLDGRGLARRKLPEHLVIREDPLPRTSSGKVVRSRLA